MTKWLTRGIHLLEWAFCEGWELNLLLPSLTPSTGSELRRLVCKSIVRRMGHRRKWRFLACSNPVLMVTSIPAASHSVAQTSFKPTSWSRVAPPQSPGVTDYPSPWNIPLIKINYHLHELLSQRTNLPLGLATRTEATIDLSLSFIAQPRRIDYNAIRLGEVQWLRRRHQVPDDTSSFCWQN